MAKCKPLKICKWFIIAILPIMFHERRKGNARPCRLQKSTKIRSCQMNIELQGLDSQFLHLIQIHVCSKNHQKTCQYILKLPDGKPALFILM